MHRRRLLLGVGILATPGIGGCLTNPRDYPGSLEISNDHDRAHSGTISVQRVSEDEDVAARKAQAPAPLTPTTTPTWRRERTFDIPAGERISDREFLTEVGSYYIEVELDAGATGATWLGLYRSAGGGVAEEKLTIWIQRDGQLSVFAPTAE